MALSIKMYRYFSLQALNPLGFPNAVRQEIESNICAEDGPQENCFHTAYCLLLQRLDKVSSLRRLTL